MLDQLHLPPKAKAKAAPKSGDTAKTNTKEAETITAATVVPVQESAGKPLPGCAVIPDIGWIVDSGSGYDIVCDDAITGRDRESICQKPAPMVVQTANGTVDVDKQMTLTVKEGSTSRINALVMNDTPCVLSLGKRCMDEGYRFVWDQYQEPKLFAPDGEQIELSVQNFVPYIRPIPSLPATQQKTTAR